MASRQQFLYRIQPTRASMLTEGPTPEEAETIRQHFAYLEALLMRGILILAGRTLNKDESCFGIVIFQAASEVEALAIMRDDPAVAQGVMQSHLFPYRIALISEANAGDMSE
ncbi:MAG TPA: YciI family protein [Chthonomonadaceae bacterium]|nr:YciI family protein [Chthonomonadaceae bacterium]